MEISIPGVSPNIGRLLFFRSDERGRTWTLREFAEQYGFMPDGINAYYGVNNTAVAHWQMKGEALRSHHRALLDDVLQELLASPRKSKTVNLGLWPFQLPDPFQFVENHLTLIETLSAELGAYQLKAQKEGKLLDIVVRYASEMNDAAKPGQPWGRVGKSDPQQCEAYRRTFTLVRKRFQERSPSVRFAFSPAIRADVRGERYAQIASYWPGDELVDVVSCTWYVGRDADFDASLTSFKAYLRDHSRSVAFGIDEIGGINGDTGNDAMLVRMLAEVGNVQKEGFKFDYATFFLGSKWGKDATLAFLRSPSSP